MKHVMVAASPFTSLVILLFGVPARAAALAEEQREVAILESSNASPQEKNEACVALKRIGSATSVPALAALLTAERLSHTARNALESMPIAEAGRALAQAVDRPPQQQGRKHAGQLAAYGQNQGDAEPGLQLGGAGAQNQIGQIEHGAGKGRRGLFGCDADGAIFNARTGRLTSPHRLFPSRA